MNRLIGSLGIVFLFGLSIIDSFDRAIWAQFPASSGEVQCVVPQDSASQGPNEFDNSEIPIEDILRLKSAHAAFEYQDFAGALKDAQHFLRKHSRANGMNAETRKAYELMANACMKLRDYPRAIDALNQLENWENDPSIPYRRGKCYLALEEYAAAADQWRRSVAMAPQNPVFRVELAMLLVTTPDRRVQNGIEASSLLKGFESQIVEMPAIAMALAAAASATGDFDTAIQMQEKYVELSIEPGVKAHAEFLLNCYHAREMPFPLFHRVLSSVSKDERRRVLEQSTVMVRVRGRVSHHLVDRGYCELEKVDRDHAGTVLDTRGLFLVCGSTVGIAPHVEDGIQPKQESSWINGPYIEVYSLAHPHPIRIGEAEIVGQDRSTNLCVLRLIKADPIDSIDGLKAITWQPGHLADLAQKGQACYSLAIASERAATTTADDALVVMTLTNSRPQPSTSYTELEIAIDQDTYQLHQESHAKDALTFLSNVVDLSDTHLRIGQPIVNQEGECVAIASPVIEPSGKVRIVGIPARELSRISRGLVSYGHIDRCQFPLQLKPAAFMIPEGATNRIVAGMEVQEVFQNARCYMEIKGNLILSVEGIATTSTTMWLIATERARAQGKTLVHCEVSTLPGGVVRTVELPILPSKSMGGKR